MDSFKYMTSFIHAFYDPYIQTELGNNDQISFLHTREIVSQLDDNFIFIKNILNNKKHNIFNDLMKNIINYLESVNSVSNDKYMLIHEFFIESIKNLESLITKEDKIFLDDMYIKPSLFKVNKIDMKPKYIDYMLTLLSSYIMQYLQKNSRIFFIHSLILILLIIIKF